MSALNLGTNLILANREPFSSNGDSNFSGREILVDYDPALAAGVAAEDADGLEAYIKHVIDFLQRGTVSIQKVRVYAEEDTQQCKEIICAVYVNADADEATSFWERLEADTSCWLGEQNLKTKGFVIDHVVTVVRW